MGTNTTKSQSIKVITINIKIIFTMAYNNNDKDKIQQQRITNSRSECENDSTNSKEPESSSRRRSPMEVSMSLTDLLKDMEHERDITNATECDLSENSSFAFDRLVADMQIGSTIRTENLPEDFIGSAIHTEHLPQSFNRVTFMDSVRKSQQTILPNDSTTLSTRVEQPERKKLVRFESISKLN